MISASHYLALAGALAFLAAPTALEASTVKRSRSKKGASATRAVAKSSASKARNSAKKSTTRKANSAVNAKNALAGFLDLPALEPGKPLAPPSVSAQQAVLSPEAMGTPQRAKERYPWKTNIVTTTFWVGETATRRNPVPNHASSWDVRWAQNYGGYDDPNRERRSGYLPVKFTPQQNPFYIALPYNDIQRSGTKPEAATVVPWFKETYERSGKSVLKGRWVAIRFKERVAYAQWEDCGPFRTDHWQYVFGNERPKPNLNKGAGLDVSPAVRDFLGMKDTDVTDWRFVEFEEVPRGPWATHGENNTFVQREREKIERTARN